MNIYYVFANTHEDGYGAMISLFGIFDSLEKARESINKAEDKHCYIIRKGQMNKWCEDFLGGYCE